MFQFCYLIFCITHFKWYLYIIGQCPISVTVGPECGRLHNCGWDTLHVCQLPFMCQFEASPDLLIVLVITVEVHASVRLFCFSCISVFFSGLICLLIPYFDSVVN